MRNSTSDIFNIHYHNFKYIAYKRRGKASKESLKALIPIYKYCRRIGLKRADIMIGITGSKEFAIRDKKIYFYDFTILPLKIIIEYNRYEFHPDPDEMSPTEIKNFKLPYDNISVDNKIKHDMAKYSAANKEGFTVLKCWSHKELEPQIIKIKEKIYECYNKANSGLL